MKILSKFIEMFSTAVIFIHCKHTTRAKYTTTESYIGCSETEFKSRYYNHIQSFKNIKKETPQSFPKHSAMPKNQVLIPQLTGK